VCATDPNEEKSFQNNSTELFLKSIIRIPCQCHVVSLALSDLKKTNFLNGVEEKLRKIIHVFRKNKLKKWIGYSCPKLCPTRWTNFDFNKFDFFKTGFNNNSHNFNLRI